MVVAYIEKALTATSVEQVWKTLCDKLDTYGFDRVIYGFTRNATPQGLGSQNEFMILSNHPDEYNRHFVDEGMCFDGPMFRWALNHVGVQSWKHIADQFDTMSDVERSIVMFNHKNDVTAGYTISFSDNKVRNKAGIGLTARKGLTQDDVEKIWEKQGNEIHVICQITHLLLTTLPHKAPGRELTPRQREALEWVGDGKTTMDISSIMGVSQATIEKHLRLAREALDVETTAQAVVKASFQNQIYVVLP